jgi:hypothetical protein
MLWYFKLATPPRNQIIEVVVMESLVKTVDKFHALVWLHKTEINLVDSFRVLVTIHDHV